MYHLGDKGNLALSSLEFTCLCVSDVEDGDHSAWAEETFEALEEGVKLDLCVENCSAPSSVSCTALSLATARQHTIKARALRSLLLGCNGNARTSNNSSQRVSAFLPLALAVVV